MKTRFLPYLALLLFFAAAALATDITRSGMVSGTSPVSVSNSGVVSMTAASASTSGYLLHSGGVLVVDAGLNIQTALAYPIALPGIASGLQGVCLFGGTPTSCTVGINYNNSSNAVALGLNAGTIIAAQGPVTSTGVHSSSVASGANGFACTTNGCRFDYGTGASDHASSDGTTVSFASPLQGAGLYSSTGVVESTATTAPLDLTSDMNAATASATVPAARICAAVALNANDLLFGVGQSGSCATERFSVDEEGDVRAVGSFGFGAMQFSAGTPTISSGGCTSPSVANGNATSFAILVGTSCTGVTDIVVGMPTSEREWNCFANNDTQGAARVIAQVAQTTTSVTLRSFARTTGLAIDLTASDTILVSCTATPPP